MATSNLDRLLKPRSIAIVGATDRPSVGRNVLVSLERLGFDGAVYPINPKRSEILGWPCFPSLADVPAPADCVAFCIGNAHLPAAFEAGTRMGMGAATIYAGGFSESADPEAQQLGAQITGLAREAGVALCGPNCMGALSTADRATTYMHEVLDPVRVSGNVGLISQSGAICIAMAADCRRFGFSRIVSSGNESVLNACDYLDFLIRDTATRVIAMFLESVREPDRFVALLDAAADAGKPVVVLKVGKSERARYSIKTHTGGLAGEAASLSAVLAAHRAIEVPDLGEMTEVLAAAQGRHWPRGERIAVMTGSGGQAGLILDVAGAHGFDLPALSATDRSEVERVVGSITGDGNPLDAWGSGDANTNYPHVLGVLGRSAGYDAVAFLGDGMDGHPLDEPSEDLVYAEMVADAAANVSKPLYFLSTRAGVFRQDQERILRPAGVAVVSGVREGLGAIRLLARWSRALPAARAVDLAPAAIPSRRPTVNEHEAKRLLAAAGVPVTREILAATREDALAALDTIGGPVVLKIASDDIPHKSDHGLVELGITSPAEFTAAWDRLQSNLARLSGSPQVAGVLVSAMVPGGTEVFVGVTRDPDYGPMLAFGLGGVLVEITHEAVLRPLPLREGDALAMVAQAPLTAKILAGVRGNEPADMSALVRAIEAVADFAWVNRDHVAEIDVNPIKVLAKGRGCVAVDAVIVPRGSMA